MLLGSHVRQVEGRSGQRISVQVENGKDQHVLAGTDILVATGRTPNTDSLDLQKTGVQVNEYGYIKVNERLLPAVPNSRTSR